MVSIRPAESKWSASRLLAAAGAFAAVAAAVVVFASLSGPDIFAAAIVSGAAVVAVAGAVAGWTGRRALLWIAALTLATGSTLGAMTVGFLFAPAAACLLGAALASRWPGSLVADWAAPTTPRRIAVRSLAGAAGVSGGAWVVRVAAFDRELFGSCAVETTACALATTNWAAFTATVAGLVAVGLGGRWLCHAAVGTWRLLRVPEAT